MSQHHIRTVYFCSAGFQVLAAAASASASAGHHILFVIDHERMRSVVASLRACFDQVVWLQGKMRSVRRGIVRWAAPLLRVLLDPCAHRPDRLCLGAYDAPGEALARLLRPRAVVLLDDGAATITVARERHAGNCRRFPRGAHFETIFHALTFGAKDTVSALPLDGLRRRVPASTKAPVRVDTVFIGSKIDASQLSLDGYMACVSEALRRYGRLGYLPHPREMTSLEAVRRCADVEILQPSGSFETMVLSGQLAASRVVGVQSTALFSALLLGWTREQIVALIPHETSWTHHPCDFQDVERLARLNLTVVELEPMDACGPA